MAGIIPAPAHTTVRTVDGSDLVLPSLADLVVGNGGQAISVKSDGTTEWALPNLGRGASDGAMLFGTGPDQALWGTISQAGGALAADGSLAEPGVASLIGALADAGLVDPARFSNYFRGLGLDASWGLVDTAGGSPHYKGVRNPVPGEHWTKAGLGLTATQDIWPFFPARYAGYIVCYYGVDNAGAGTLAKFKQGSVEATQFYPPDYYPGSGARIGPALSTSTDWTYAFAAMFPPGTLGADTQYPPAVTPVVRDYY